MKHIAQPQNGKINFVNRELLMQDILQYENNLVEITIKRKRKDRSNAQNAYYFGVIIPLALQGFLDLGNDRDSKGNRIGTDYVHKFFKAEFLTYESEITLKTGEVINKTFVGSTTELNTKEFSDYVENICMWCANYLDISIPFPNPNYKETENETF